MPQAVSFSWRIIFFSVAVRFSVSDYPLRCLLIALNTAYEFALTFMGWVEEPIEPVFVSCFECLLVLLLSLEPLIRFLSLSSKIGWFDMIAAEPRPLDRVASRCDACDIKAFSPMY